MWIVRLCRRRKTDSHSVHGKGFSPVCTLRCSISFDDSENALPHCLQTNFVVRRFVCSSRTDEPRSSSVRLFVDELSRFVGSSRRAFEVQVRLPRSSSVRLLDLSPDELPEFVGTNKNTDLFESSSGRTDDPTNLKSSFSSAGSLVHPDPASSFRIT